MASGDSVVKCRGFSASQETTTLQNGESVGTRGKQKSRTSYLNEVVLLQVVGLLLITVFVSIVADRHLPQAKTLLDSLPGEFVEERARIHLEAVTRFGDRVVGSHANEVLATNYIIDVLTSIKRNSRRDIHDFDVELQEVSGSFNLDFLWGFTSVYKNVKNILAKIAPKSGSEHSLLVNCHFDSVNGSPGASDDMVSCALMLEVIHVLSLSNNPLNHSIVFNFNGAEENILQASHGFITQHRWAKQIRAFINLESTGAGGREFVFQTGPENPWMVHTYARAAKYPYGNVLGQEIFQSGLIPADTDFRIYRDFGNLPGIDIAYISNGYVYHTKYDSAENIPPGCIQRGGDNLLNMVQAFGRSELLSDPGQYRHGSMVFFDVLGLFMVTYPQRLGVIINVLTMSAVVLRIFRRSFGNNKVSKHYLRLTLTATAANVVAIFTSFAVVITISMLVVKFGAAMFWFTNTLNVIPIYIMPTFLVIFTTNYFLSRQFLRRSGLHMADEESVHFDGVLLLWTLLLFVGTAANVCSAYIPLIMTLVPLMLRWQTESALRHAYIGGLRWRYSLLYFVPLAFPFALTVYMCYNCAFFFLPLMGRTGTSTSSDMVIAVLAAFAVNLTSLYLTGVVHVLQSFRWLLSALAGFFLFAFLLIVFTPIGFPYGGNPSSPSVNRHYLCHTNRYFHDNRLDMAAVTASDSGIWHVPFDCNGITRIASVIPELAHSRISPYTYHTKLYSEMPYYFPIHGLMKESYFLPMTPFKPLSNVLQVKMLGKKRIGENLYRLFFSVRGPDHITVHLSPAEGVELTKWSLTEEVPMENELWQNRKTYFIFYSHGKKPDEAWTFWLQFETPPTFDEDSMIFLDIAFASHYMHGAGSRTPQLISYMHRFPSWTYANGWSATYDKWVI